MEASMGIYRKNGEKYDPNFFCILKYIEPSPLKCKAFDHTTYIFFSTPLWSWVLTKIDFMFLVTKKCLKCFILAKWRESVRAQLHKGVEKQI